MRKINEKYKEWRCARGRDALVWWRHCTIHPLRTQATLNKRENLTFHSISCCFSKFRVLLYINTGLALNYLEAVRFILGFVKGKCGYIVTFIKADRRQTLHSFDPRNGRQKHTHSHTYTYISFLYPLWTFLGHYSLIYGQEFHIISMRNVK